MRSYDIFRTVVLSVLILAVAAVRIAHWKYHDPCDCATWEVGGSRDDTP